ncbi:hypothetical protein EK21DRAFT_107061 [Setomelanomma holmii]|uniref:Uncharacterized protein n=1 Tax=Setomelanomma holmii TaxID=210430 RepID=A0A9P4LPX4_9PLEO|nr:hypothetical protein EK21DRAFT_107061 [Setomelanomma holmii]
MAATRLRRTFQYPSESDDEDAVEQGMDEHDQDTLISNLTTHDQISTRLYTLALSCLPLVPILLHMPLLLYASTFLPSLLAITSFLTSAYMLYFLPLPPVKVGIIDTDDLKKSSVGKKRVGYGWNVPSTSAETTAYERKPVPFVSDGVADLAVRYIVPANGVVCVLLALLELWQRRTWSEGIAVGGGYLPGFVMSVVLWLRRELRVMDMSELERLKYRSKAT